MVVDTMLVCAIVTLQLLSIVAESKMIWLRRCPGMFDGPFIGMELRRLLRRLQVRTGLGRESGQQ